MTDYKLVPFEPTPEMVSAAEDAYMPFGDMDLALRMAILAAPDVQGEPVYWQCVWPCGGTFTTDSYEPAKNYQEAAISWHGEDQAPFIRPLFAAPQPAEQSACPVCHGEGLNPLTEVPVPCANCHGVKPAEQQPAPDVAGWWRRWRG